VRSARADDRLSLPIECGGAPDGSGPVNTDTVGKVVPGGDPIVGAVVDFASTLDTQSKCLVVVILTHELSTPTAGVLDLCEQADFTRAGNAHNYL
jgi:hypothetical protein